MIKTKHIVGFIISTLFISACGSKDYMEQKESTMKVKTDLKALMDGQKSHFIYAPPVDLTPISMDKPRIWSDRIRISMNSIDMPISAVLADINRRLKTTIYWGVDTSKTVMVRVNVDGSLTDLIRSIESQTDYKLDTSKENVISVLAWETDTFSLFNLVGEHGFMVGKDAAGDIEEGQDSSVDGSSGSLFNADQNQFANIKSVAANEITDAIAVIEKMLGEKNEFGQVHANMASGTITVTTKPRIMQTVRNYIDQINEMYGQMVRIDVKILTFQSSKDNSFGVDWDLVRKTTNGSLNFTSPASGGEGGLSFSATGGLFEGSSVLVNALRKQGSVSLVTSPSMLAINNRVGEIESLRKEAYVKDVTLRDTGDNENSNSYAEVNQGVVSEGFSMRALVKIVGDEVLMQVSATVSKLGTFGEVDTPTVKIKTPNMSEERFNQPLKVRDGRTIILGGYTQSSIASDETDSFHNSYLGNNKGREQKSHTMVLLTPTIMR